MFTWICPQCGRECPPSYTECPDCAQKGAAAAAAVASAPAAPAPPVAASPPVTTAAMGAPAFAPRPAGMPTWLLSIVFALAFFGVGAGVYIFTQRGHGTSAPATAAPAPRAPFETPTAAPANPATAAHPYMRYLEITGWRLLQDPRKRPEIKFVVVNHSGAEMADLGATVFLRAHAGKETEPIGSFKFNVPSLGAYESRDVTAPLETKLKVYEWPDWQKLFEEIQITSPVLK